MASEAWSQLARARQLCLAATALLPSLHADAAEIFASVDSQGVAHYATQRLDATYRPLFQDATPVARSRPGTADIQALIDRIAQRHGLPRELVTAIADVESNFNTRAVSPKGARGAMQLMPRTAARYGIRPADLFDAERNIDAGARYLKDLLARYRGNTVLALAAYNAGAGAVNRHGERVPPYGETMLYVPAVLARAAAASRSGEAP